MFEEALKNENLWIPHFWNLNSALDQLEDKESQPSIIEGHQCPLNQAELLECIQVSPEAMNEAAGVQENFTPDCKCADHEPILEDTIMCENAHMNIDCCSSHEHEESKKV